MFCFWSIKQFIAKATFETATVTPYQLPHYILSNPNIQQVPQEMGVATSDDQKSL